MRPWRALLLVVVLLPARATGENPAAPSAGAVSTPPPAAADPTTTAERSRSSAGSLGLELAVLRQALAPHGHVTTLKPRLLERDDDLPLVLPAEAVRDDTSSCTTVIVLGSSNASFVLQFKNSAGLRPAWPTASAAGLASLTHCGNKKSLLGDLSIILRSPRALLETVVLESAAPPPAVTDLLPSRDAGPTLPSPVVGPRPEGRTAGDLAATIRDENTRRGARSQRSTNLVIDQDGLGSSTLSLSAGCHRFYFLAAASKDSGLDIDARLSTLSGDELKRDESESAQAELRLCTSKPDRYVIMTNGAYPGSAVTLLHAEWDLPEGLPLSWGVNTRAAMADALWRDLPPRVKRTPIKSFLGVQGRTDLWLETRPDACYLVGASRMRGDFSFLALEVQGDSLQGQSHAAEWRFGTSLGFCANGESRVRIRITTAGDNLAWIAAAWEFPEDVSP